MCAIANLEAHHGYDEVAAKRVENELVGLGTEFAEAKLKISWLEGALPDGLALELLERVRSHVAEAESEMARLMCEAKKQVRGE